MACSCSSPVASTASHFDERKVRQELAAYRRGGAGTTTQGLLGLLTPVGPMPETMLDIGSGIGALSFGMLAAGVRRATCVDLSRAALAANAEEARRRGVGDRIEQVEADFVAIASKLPVVDLVTLDRVVCCYPAYAPLLEHAAAHARRLLAISYPRDRWWVRFGLLVENAWWKLRGDSFRVFLHPPAAMMNLLHLQGFTRTRAASSFAWQVELYVRNAP
jgi:methyltransferase family protein